MRKYFFSFLKILSTKIPFFQTLEANNDLSKIITLDIIKYVELLSKYKWAIYSRRSRLVDTIINDQSKNVHLA